MRALIDRKDAPMNLRIEAINSFNSDRATTDDAAYLRGLYAQGRQRSDEGGDHQRDRRASAAPENEQWVLAVAKNPNESSQLRVRRDLAPDRARPPSRSRTWARSTTPRTATTSARRSCSILGSRKEPEAADKLIDIAKNSTDHIDRDAGDQRAHAPQGSAGAAALIDIIDGKKP